MRGQLGEQFRWREPVGDDDVGVRQQPAAAHGDQFGVAGSAADQGHTAVQDAGGSSAAMSPR